MTAPGRQVEMGLNVAPRNHREAALSIGLALFVILELTVFIGVLNNTAMDLLVKPVAAILHVIRTQAGKVMAALDKDDVSHESPLVLLRPLSHEPLEAELHVFWARTCYFYTAGIGHCVIQFMYEQTHLLSRLLSGNALASVSSSKPG